MVVWRIPPKYGSKNGFFGYILNMYTVPQARNKGICSRLLKELIEEAKRLQISQLHLHSSEDGIGIYKKAGFIAPEHSELVLSLE